MVWHQAEEFAVHLGDVKRKAGMRKHTERLRGPRKSVDVAGCS